MSGGGLRIDGHDQALAALANLAARTEHPRPLWEAIGASLVKSTQRRFEDGRAPDGTPWPPSLRALSEGGKTLIDTARLMQSITFNAFDTGVEVGTNVVYAAIHQFGGIIKQPAREQTLHFKTHKRTGKRLKGFRKESKADIHQTVAIPAHEIKMPARPFLGLDDHDDAEIIRIAEDYVGGQDIVNEARP